LGLGGDTLEQTLGDKFPEKTKVSIVARAIY